MNKNEILRVAANEFAEKIHKLSSPLRMYEVRLGEISAKVWRVRDEII